MRILTVFLAFVATLSCEAQFASTLNDRSLSGTFYVSVDDAATIYINGSKFYGVGIGEHRSPETELKTGDRIVLHLRNDTAGRRFRMVFAGSDGQTIVNFRARNFKIVEDLDVTDFKPEDLSKWTKYAKDGGGKNNLPVKNYSDWMWGDLNKCILAGVVTHQMFSQRPK
jgi:hypothetical protein